MKKIYFLLLGIVCAAQLNAQLIINELSQGPSGTKEYVELLVVGTPTCGSNTVDLRGWIIDDNNGWHASGSGTGIAQGYVRFRNVAQWANVKIGSLILIYNDADVPPSLPANDVTDANADCRYIIPISNTALFERHTTLPSTASSTYPTTGLVNGGDWDMVAMANSGDAFHTVAPTNLTAPYHAIGFGNNTALNNVYFATFGGGSTIAMRNLVDNNPFNAANYDVQLYAGNSTPGAPNNTANAAWITSLNNNCQPVATTIVRDTVARPLCQGDTVNIRNTVINTAGFYNDTIAAVGPACDTIRTYNVTVSQLNTKTVPLALCQGESTVINGQTITTAGSYLDTILSTTSCDTLVTYNVTVTPRPTTSRAITLCPGQSVVINGQTVNTAGTYTDTVAAAIGCDTVRTNNVTVNPYNTRTAPTITLCPGQSTVINGQTVTAAGTYLDTLASNNGGCDTVVTYNVQTGNAIPVAISTNLCPGEFVVINGQQVTTAGTYTETRPATGGGCDTTVTYMVTTSGYIQPAAATIHACQGQSIVIDGNTYTANATIRDTVASTTTCDTIFSFNLVFHAPTNTTVPPVTICQGQSYFAGGALQTTSGTYVDTYTSQYGCDSTITTQLNVIQPTTQNISENICVGNSYLGNVITVDTTYTITYQSQGGCDSAFVTYILTAIALPVVTVSADTTIDEGNTVELSATGGTSYAWSSGENSADINVAPTATTTYIVTVSNIDGCSVVDSTTVTVIPTPEVEVKIPTAFSPNGDTHNDLFDVLNRFQVRVDEFRIYNRWGELVFNSPEGKWDGRFRGMEQPIGVYVYYLKVTYLKSGKQDALQGNVTLIR